MLSLYMLVMRILSEYANNTLPTVMKQFITFHNETKDELLMWNKNEVSYLNNISQQGTWYISPENYFSHFKRFFTNSTEEHLFDDFDKFLLITHIVQYYSFPLMLQEWKQAMNLPNVTDNNTKLFQNDVPVYSIIPGLDLVKHIQPKNENEMVPNYVNVVNGSLYHYAGKFFKKGDYYGYTRLGEPSSAYLLLYYGILYPNNAFDYIPISLHNNTESFSEGLHQICSKFNCMGIDSYNNTLKYRIKESEQFNLRLMSYVRLMNLYTFHKDTNATALMAAYNNSHHFGIDNELYSLRTYAYILSNNIKYPLVYNLIRNEI